MSLLCEKGMRIGVSYVSKKLIKVNNKYLKCYDLKQKSKLIIHYDLTTLIQINITAVVQNVLL